MSRALQIFELRLSFTWTEVFPTLLVHGAPGAPMRFLADEDEFAVKYEEIVSRSDDILTEWNSSSSAAATGDPTPPSMAEEVNKAYRATLKDPGLLTLPWLSLGSSYLHHFWQYYFRNTEPSTLDGKGAWSYVVPLRATIPVSIGSPWPPDGPKLRVMMDGLLYPHGVAVELTIRILFDNGSYGARQGVGLARLMDRALQVRNGLPFPVILPDGRKQAFKLDEVAKQCLTYLHARVLGKGAARGTRPTEPLTVATVVQGDGANLDRPVIAGSDLHQALAGLCSWKPTWQQQQDLTSPTDSNLLVSDRTSGHLVYHLKRGRAVWMPTYFCLKPPHAGHKLGCYHRNLSLVSLQTEMLAKMAVLFMDVVEGGKPPSPAMKSLAENAVHRLGELYSNESKGSEKLTYNSASSRLYLEENGYVDIINKARTIFGLSPLIYQHH